MSLPQLSHLQAAVLDALGHRELSGRDLREALNQRRIKKDGPAFYQLMSRLEEAKLVEGHYDEKIVDGQRIKERRYILKGEGAKALQETAAFYSQITSSYELA
jgi:DNA-binding PadR family transcriptional regulator